MAKVIHKANVSKEGDSIFQGLRSILNVFSNSAQGDVVFISVDHITLDVVSNALRNRANGGIVLAIKSDDPNISTFHACYASVLDTVNKHAFFIAELDYIRCNDPNNSSSVGSDCCVLDCVNSTI